MAMPNYTKMYDDLHSKLRELCDERADLEGKLGDISKEIASLQLTMNNLAPLAGYSFCEFDDSNINNLGITAAVQSVLDQTRMSAAEIRAKMQEKGFDFSEYSAPDATVRTILNRLVEAEKAEMEKENWKTFYKSKATQAVEISDEDIPF